jgi:hypothetical protein
MNVYHTLHTTSVDIIRPASPSTNIFMLMHSTCPSPAVLYFFSTTLVCDKVKFYKGPIVIIEFRSWPREFGLN